MVTESARSGMVADDQMVLPANAPPRDSGRQSHAGRWTFLTNHSHVLILLSRNPSMVLRQVAQLVGITERAVQRIIADLEEEGFIEREKVGRQNHYRILKDQPLRHSVEAHCTIGDLLGLVEKKRRSVSSTGDPSEQTLVG